MRAGSTEPEANSNAQLRSLEFTALYSEIENRSNNQHQLVSLAIVAAGTILTIGLQQNADLAVYALLVYPIIAMFLAVAWEYHDFWIGQIAEYIHNHLEQGQGWETYLRRIRVNTKGFTAPEQGLFSVNAAGLGRPRAAKRAAHRWHGRSAAR